MTRFFLAAIGILVAICAAGAGSGVLLLAGLVATVPFLRRVAALPRVGRSAFLLTAVVAGLLLAAGVTGHHTPDLQRPVAAAHVTAVAR